VLYYIFFLKKRHDDIHGMDGVIDGFESGCGDTVNDQN